MRLFNSIYEATEKKKTGADKKSEKKSEKTAPVKPVDPNKLVPKSPTEDINPGNSAELGVSNHRTPIENIVIGVNNLFASHLGIVAAVGEDGVSLKLNSSKFVSKEAVTGVLMNPEIYRGISLYEFVKSQGLDGLKIIPYGMYFVVYFYPKDVNTAMSPADIPQPQPELTKEGLEEVEMFTILEDNDDDDDDDDNGEEMDMSDEFHKNVIKIITQKDKIQAAKDLQDLIAGRLDLPNDFYFAGVKAKNGDESIALRWRYTHQRPKGQSAQITKSLINIFGLGDDGIWVNDFVRDSIVKLPDDVEKLVKNILSMLDAEKTDNPAVYKLSKDVKKNNNESDKKTDDDDKKKDNDDDLLGGSSDDEHKPGHTDSEGDNKLEDDDSHGDLLG